MQLSKFRLVEQLPHLKSQMPPQQVSFKPTMPNAIKSLTLTQELPDKGIALGAESLFYWVGLFVLRNQYMCTMFFVARNPICIAGNTHL